MITPLGLADKLTVTPAGGAGALRVMVPLMLRPNPTDEPIVSEMDGSETVTLAVKG